MRDKDVIGRIKLALDREVQARRQALARSFDYSWMLSWRGWGRFLAIALWFAIKGWVYIVICLLGLWVLMGAETGPVLKFFEAMQGNMAQ